jgi:hypothetical protein
LSAKAILLLVLGASILNGCTAGARLAKPSGEKWKPEEVVARYLDRWTAWTSLKTGIRVSIVTGDSSFAARGHLFYLLGERYEIGFSPPYNRILGNLYLTPEQVIYWDLQISPRVFNAQDTVVLSDILPIRIPNWDPRDMLPFPVSGRSGGFQTDSIWQSGDYWLIRGNSTNAVYILTIAPDDGVIQHESVWRVGRDPIVKSYTHNRSLNGWPISKVVTCRDTSSSFELTWSLRGTSLDAVPFHARTEAIKPLDAGTSP